MRVLLVQPPHRDTFGYSMPPLGVLHTGATARRRGHAVAFDDLALALRRGDLPADDSLIDRCARRLLDQQPEVLGLGVMLSALPAALHLVGVLHRLAPELPVILGGQGPETVEAAVIARHPGVAAVAVGEADETLADWLDALDAAGDPAEATRRPLGADVPGLVLRDTDGRPLTTPRRPVLPDLDAVDPPAWDLAESPAAYAAAAGGGEALVPLDLGRGCAFRCSFCTTSVFWDSTARYLSPARAVDELDRVAALPGADVVYVTHDLFTADRDHVLAVCAEKRRRGNELVWECRTRLDLVDRELLEALADAGCRRILYGVESASPEQLLAMRKGGRSCAPGFDVLETLGAAADAGVASIVGTMAGLPGETEEQLEETLQLMSRAATLDGVSLSLHWWNVTPGNGRAAEAGDGLALVPGLVSDLVRGSDLPPGHVHPEQARLIAEDPEIFGAFRVHSPGHSSHRQLHLLTRNAHLVLEVLPRSLAGLALRRGTTLLALLRAWLDGLDQDADAALAHERAEHGEPWDEPGVLHRGAAVRLASALVRRADDPDLAALLAYERALFETEGAELLRCDRDPRVVRAAVDARRWPPPPSEPTALLFVRRGERVGAHALSPFLAAAWSEADDGALLADWPGARAADLASARELLRRAAGRPHAAARD